MQIYFGFCHLINYSIQKGDAHLEAWFLEVDCCIPSVLIITLFSFFWISQKEWGDVRKSEGMTFFIMQNHFDDYVLSHVLWVLMSDSKDSCVWVWVCASVCVCLFMTSGEVIAFSWSVLFVSEDTWD